MVRDVDDACERAVVRLDFSGVHGGLLGGAGNAAGHAAEDGVVDREEQAPVEFAPVGHGLEVGGLDQVGMGFVARFDLKFEPGVARDVHFGVEQEASAGDHVHHAPEVDGVADPQRDGVAASSAEADAADRAVHCASKPPECVGVVPADGPADTANLVEQDVGRRGAGDALLVVDREVGGREVDALRRATPADQTRARPAGLDLAAFDLGEGEAHGLVEAEPAGRY